MGIVDELKKIFNMSESKRRSHVGMDVAFWQADGLGFIGELGFTSVSQEIFLYDYCTADADERSNIRSNFKGDSDKYARGIARRRCVSCAQSL